MYFRLIGRMAYTLTCHIDWGGRGPRTRSWCCCRRRCALARSTDCAAPTAAAASSQHLLHQQPCNTVLSVELDQRLALTAQAGKAVQYGGEGHPQGQSSSGHQMHVAGNYCYAQNQHIGVGRPVRHVAKQALPDVASIGRCGNRWARMLTVRWLRRRQPWSTGGLESAASVACLKTCCV